MNPGSQWIVELGARENQAREQRWREKSCQADEIADTVTTPTLPQRCLGAIGQLLLVSGAWLKRQAGEVYPAGGGIETLRDWRAGRGKASWT